MNGYPIVPTLALFCLQSQGGKTNTWTCVNYEGAFSHCYQEKQHVRHVKIQSHSCSYYTPHALSGRVLAMLMVFFFKFNHSHQQKLDLGCPQLSTHHASMHDPHQPRVSISSYILQHPNLRCTVERTTFLWKYFKIIKIKKKEENESLLSNL